MKRRFLPLLVAALAGGFGPAAWALDNPWSDLGQFPQNRPAAERWIQPDRARPLVLDVKALRDVLAQAQPESARPTAAAPTELLLPLPDGTFGRFRIVEAPIMEPELAAKFPEIKTYLGQGLDDPTATARLDWTPAGFHSQVLSADGAVYVDPAFRNDVTLYSCYARRDLSRNPGDFTCLLPDEETPPWEHPAGHERLRSSGTNLRTYRLACAATGEYTAYHGGSVAQGMAAIVTAVNRVTGVYEREVAVRLVLIANNDLIVFTNASTDPYTNNSGSTMLGQNQTTLTAVIGSANYDIGHVFSTGGGGIASLGSVCGASVKARGVTGSPAPTGDAFWIDYVAHEMGHQFGANHCFNSSAGNCGGGNRNASTAYEPGSASTIMGYAGICGTDDLQPNSDPYFHAISFDEIVVFTTASSGNNCAVLTASGNTPPTVSAGPAYTIPRSTPFTLTATASDPDGDLLTYCWEEWDLGVSTTLTAADNGSSPIFRSFNPSTSPSRTFPQWSDILNNRTTLGEKLPTTSRTMKFRVTVRDNRAGAGGANTADTTVTSVSTAGPFLLTSPNTAGTRSGFVNVTWNVAGTADAPINAIGVNILLSTNGGTSYPFVLASNTPNDGAESVLLPNLTSSTARFKIEGAGNIFFDVSNTNFSIVPGADVLSVDLASVSLAAENCGGGNGYVDPGETVTVNVALRATGTLNASSVVATLLATNGLVLCSGPQNFGTLLAGGPAVSRPFTFTATGACSGTITARFLVQSGLDDLAPISVPFILGAASGLVTNSFTNATALTIPGVGTKGPADLYPSPITVAGLGGSVARVTVSLRGLSHTYSDDLDVLLVGPGGQSVLLLSDAGGSSVSANLNLTFSDAGSSALPDATALSSGTWLPSNYGTGDVFDAPAPAGPYGAALSVFNGTDGNGEWSLYVLDDGNGDAGSLADGWSLSIVTTNLSCCTGTSDLALGGSATPAGINLSNTVTFTLGVTNLGPAAALNVVLSDLVPAGFAVLSATASQGAAGTAGNLVTADLGPLAAGTVATVQILARGVASGNWTNAPTVTASTGDPAAANNTAVLPVLVNSAPTLTGLAAVLAWEGVPLAPISFQVGDAETPAANLTLAGTSSNTNLLPLAGIVFGGSGANRTLTLVPRPGQIGNAIVGVTVSDGLATATSNIPLTVAARPQVAPPVVVGGTVQITWSTVPGQTYQVQFKDVLSQPTWTNLGDPRLATGANLTTADLPPLALQRFYRVILVE